MSYQPLLSACLLQTFCLNHKGWIIRYLISWVHSDLL